MKKTKAIKIIIPMLCAAFLFAGCATAYARKSANRSSEKQSSYSEGAASNSTGSFNGTTYDEAEKSGIADLEALDSSVVSDVFSERDLSGEYDDEVVAIRLTGSGATESSDKVSVSDSNVVISGAGTYLLSGSLKNGSIIVDAGSDDKVQLVFRSVNISSDSYAAIYVKQANKVFITLEDGSENVLSNGGSFSQQDENNVDAVIFSKDDITLNGAGYLTVTSPSGHGIVGKDDVTITGGT